MERSSRAYKALLLSPVVILFASASRLIIISNYDTTTATTIATSTGAISTLLGTVVPLLPLFLPALFIVLVILRRWSYAFLTALAAGFVSPAYTESVTEGLGQASTRGEDIWRRLDIWPRVDNVASVIETIRRWFGNAVEYIQIKIWPTENSQQELVGLWETLPWVFICAAVALLMVFLNPPRPLRASDSSNTIPLTNPNLVVLIRFFWWIWRWLGKALYGIVIALACAYAVLVVGTIYRVPFDGGIVSDILRRPWLPAEEVRVAGTDDPLVGYTLSTSDGWHVLLVEPTRQIRYIRSPDVTARTVCHVKRVDPPEPPLIRLVGAGNSPTSTCLEE